jgi:hypothetical protein
MSAHLRRSLSRNISFRLLGMKFWGRWQHVTSDLTTRDLLQAATFARWREAEPANWIPFKWLALLEPLLWLAGTIAALVYAVPSKAESITWTQLVSWLAVAVLIKTQYQSFLATFGLKNRRLTRLRDLIAGAYFCPDLAKADYADVIPRIRKARPDDVVLIDKIGNSEDEVGNSEFKELNLFTMRLRPLRYPMRQYYRRRKLTREGSRSERLFDARRWASVAVLRDLAQVLFIMVIAAQSILFALWSIGAVHSTHPISAHVAQKAIVFDIADSLLRTIPTLELQDVLGITQSELFNHSLLYRLVLFVLRIGVLVPIISALISLFGIVRTFNPSNPLVEDSIVQATVGVFTRKGFRRITIIPPESFAMWAADEGARTLNSRATSSGDGKPWTGEKVRDHINRTGVFA